MKVPSSSDASDSTQREKVSKSAPVFHQQRSSQKTLGPRTRTTRKRPYSPEPCQRQVNSVANPVISPDSPLSARQELEGPVGSFQSPDTATSVDDDGLATLRASTTAHADNETTHLPRLRTRSAALQGRGFPSGDGDGKIFVGNHQRASLMQPKHALGLCWSEESQLRKRHVPVPAAG